MVLVTQSKRMWFAGVAVSLLIFAVLYFTVIRPDNNTANQLAKQGQQAVNQGLQQSQQVIKQAQQQAKSAGASGSSAAAAGSAATNKTINKTVDKAQKLTNCVAAAGTDPSKLQACQVKFAN
jgi:methylmalonyl-CoA mutase cobalamin-binding subunit